LTGEIKTLTSKGIIPVEHDFETLGDDIDDETMDQARPFLMGKSLYERSSSATNNILGKAAAVVTDKKSAKALVDEMINDAVAAFKVGQQMTAKL